jgi:hypothetical protein
MTRTHKQQAAAVESAILEIGDNKTTDKKIAAACKKHGVDVNKVIIIGGYHEGGTRQAQIKESITNK